VDGALGKVLSLMVEQHRTENTRICRAFEVGPCATDHIKTPHPLTPTRTSPGVALPGIALQAIRKRALTEPEDSKEMFAMLAYMEKVGTHRSPPPTLATVAVAALTYVVAR
jgi:hypothetical protein